MGTYDSVGAGVAARVSPIHGTGLFATRAFKAGEVICEYRGERISKDESRRRTADRPEDAPVFIVALDDASDLDGDVPENPAKFANHGCEPNAILTEEDGGLKLRAGCEITPDEEILFDYGYGLAESLARPCRCGSPRCFGRILAEPFRHLWKKHTRTRGVR